ncbi:MAG: hypothetical protein IIV90_01915 [Oscillospiraceae bacterium]|nr:hypothetical protein [Oscillospiraceae bacterium]
MAFFTCKLKSEALGGSTTVRIYHPADRLDPEDREVKGVITLLHGYTNDGDDWVHNSAALRYAGDNGLVLIIPDGRNSFYCDHPDGPAWETWITKEMPEVLGRMFPLPRQREKNFVCGLSMGGYGALRLALRHPELYAGAGSFSGCVHLNLMAEHRDSPAGRFAFLPILGPGMKMREDLDLFCLAKEAAALPPAQRPRLLCTAGRQDHKPYFIYTQNTIFRDYMKALPLDYTYWEWDGGHEWSFWDRSLVLAIDHFLAPGYAQKVQEQWSCPKSERSGER